MPNSRTGGFISKIRFNNGEEIDIAANDIVIFVGPNNAGKSQSLKDIYSLSAKKLPSIVVSDITVTKYAGSLSSLLDSISSGYNQGKYISYPYLGGTVSIWGYSNENFQKSAVYDDYRDLFVANLNTENRLTICNPPQSINRNAAKGHPIHYAAFDKKYRKWLSGSFKKAFDVELTPNTQFGASIPLCIGAPVKFTKEFDDEQDRQEEYADILGAYKQVQDQGDGIKSFTGILLYLMLDYYCTYLIDEPESFLHPPQAKIMGQIIGETLKDDQQAFISTHSEDIIKGLIETCPERVKIVRITRKEDTNSFSILNNTVFNEVWNDPLLKYSNIMSSLFHNSVVLCESDSDCKMYSIIESHIKQQDGKYSETLFIHCGGKQRMAKVVKALSALNIDVKLIPDIDILNDEAIFKNVIETFGIEWDSLRPDYNIIVSNLHSPVERINRNTAKAAIEQVFNSSTAHDLSTGEIEDIRNTIKTISKWDSIKKVGRAALPAGDSTDAFGRMDCVLKEHGIHIVPVGELENFVREVGGHGPSWVNAVLVKYTDLNDAVYSQITDFIRGINLQ
ncbi:MAG: AAA family ATPase [Bacillota bacterium]|nr:AAA family ATPase [Bacillota bacterium]